MYDPYAGFQKAILPNGLTIYLATWDRPWLKAEILVHAGAKDDPADKDGVAHFVEHMLSENLETFSMTQIHDAFANLGGHASLGSTGYTSTTYGFSVPLEGKNLSFALEIFGSMLITCDLRKGVEKERTVILNEYNEKFQTKKLCDLDLKKRKVFFDGTRLGNFLRPVGKLETIQKISLEDIRDFYDRHYVPANITVVAVGGISLEELVRHLQKSKFGIEKDGQRTILPEAIQGYIRPKENHWELRSKEMLNLKLSQSKINLHTSAPKSVNAAALNIAGLILRKELFKELRAERGLIYDLMLEKASYPEAHEMSVSIKFSQENITSIVALIDSAIAQASTKVDVIRRSIDDYRKKYVIVDPNASQIIESFISALVVTGQPENLTQWLATIEAVKVEEVQRIIHQFASENRLTCILHP